RWLDRRLSARLLDHLICVVARRRKGPPFPARVSPIVGPWRSASLGDHASLCDSVCRPAALVHAGYRVAPVPVAHRSRASDTPVCTPRGIRRTRQSPISGVLHRRLLLALSRHGGACETG